MTWAEMDESEREAIFERGLDRIFDPALIDSISRLVEDVAERGDRAVSDALAEFDGVAIAPDELAIDPAEIEDARWVSREDVAMAMTGGHPEIKPARKGSIAHFLLQLWLADRVE